MSRQELDPAGLVINLSPGSRSESVNQDYGSMDPNLDFKKIYTDPHHWQQHRHQTLKMTKAKGIQETDLKLSKYFQKLVRNAKKQYTVNCKNTVY